MTSITESDLTEVDTVEEVSVCVDFACSEVEGLDDKDVGSVEGDRGDFTGAGFNTTLCFLDAGGVGGIGCDGFAFVGFVVPGGVVESRRMAAGQASDLSRRPLSEWVVDKRLAFRRPQCKTPEVR